MTRGRGIPVLAPSEDLLWQGEINGVKVAVTNLRLIMTRGLWLKDILLSSIHSVELTISLGLVVLGLFIAFVLPWILALMIDQSIGVLEARNSTSFKSIELLPFIIVGLIIAIYGWLNRHRLVIYYTGGKVVLKGSGSVRDLMIQLREALLKARPGGR
ncbi:hypothetical protein Pyrde_2041 [Pyrodictium delaneyi]|uniref:Uncharacterized protein n=1 Tax=Pyrodictium delaneyi TaxID=1273541 RepID=A0A0P0N607_9CREN|nr:hypothetical protein [Pyrodictium delaneyi]ALL02084.1 hypothetical protein Pyrde_2041 [Pyrodictium delaneyi]